MTTRSTGVACAVAVIVGTAGSATAAAQDGLYPIIGATLTGEGADTFVFQCLLGATVDGGGFALYEEAAPRLAGDQEVRWFSLAGEQGSGISHAAVPFDEPCTYAFTTEADLAATVPGGYVGVGGPGAALPSALALDDVGAAEYREIATAFFESVGHTSAALTVTQAIRTDLEGDGSEEVIVVVTDDADGLASSVAPGDHSVVLLHRDADGAEETVMIDGEFYDEHHEFAAKYEFEVIGVVDLDGDGLQEIIVDARYYEGSAFIAYSMGEDGRYAEAVSCGCGA